MDAPLLTGLDKGLPPDTAGLTSSVFVAGGPRLADLVTPVAVLDDAALDANVARMAAWCADRGVALAPHGKTSMAPALWQRQLDAGAWGITVATPAQLRVAVAAGVPRILLANPLVDPVALRWLDGVSTGPEITVWADDVDTVAAMDAGSLPADRSGCWSSSGPPAAGPGRDRPRRRLPWQTRWRRAPGSGWPGWPAGRPRSPPTRPPASVARVQDFLHAMVGLHEELLSRGQYATDEVLLTAGGSTFFDVVADVLGAAAGPGVTALLRSGCYLTHDDGLYRTTSPLSRAGTPFTAALHVWARVLSRPEPGLALLDAGRRDLGVDAGMPEPELVADELGGVPRALLGATVSALNDQHAFLRLPADTELRVGQVVRLGISHPCTTLDKWRWLPVVGPGDNPAVVDLVPTYF